MILIQTIIFGLTLIAIVWYAELTRRMHREIRRQADTALLSHDSYKLSVSAEWLLKLKDRFESREFLERRQQASMDLLAGRWNISVEGVWEFFETLGHFTKRWLVDEEMVWSTFYHWINGYWHASEKYLSEDPEKFPLLWVHFEYLYSVVKAIDRCVPN